MFLLMFFSAWNDSATMDELAHIPERHRPDGKIKRSEVIELDMPSFSTVANREGVIFDGEDAKKPEPEGPGQ